MTGDNEVPEAVLDWLERSQRALLDYLVEKHCGGSEPSREELKKAQQRSKV